MKNNFINKFDFILIYKYRHCLHFEENFIYEKYLTSLEDNFSEGIC